MSDPDVTPEEKKSFAYNTNIMLKSYFEDSEKNGTGGLRPHLAIEKGEFL
jgi:hypothetical protein